MNIAIYDAEHYEGVYPLIKIFGTANNRLTIFTSSSSIDRLHEMLKGDFFKHKWIVIEPQKRSFKYFRRVKALLQVAKAEFVIFNTISTHQHFYAKLIDSVGADRCMITVHNINNFFEPSPGIGIKSFLNNIGKRKLKKNLHYFNVINEALLPKLQEQLNAGQEAITIPGGLFEATFPVTPLSSPIKLVVPGTVDKGRRNYDQIFDLAVMAESIELPLEISIVGGMQSAYARQLIERINASSYQYVTIHYTDYPVVPQPVYDEAIGKGHFIWIPSIIHFQMEKGLPEIYGVTKSSGNVFDIIRSSKPYLAPTALNMPLELQETGFHYQHLRNLIEYLQELHLHPEQYNELLINSQKVAQNFSVDAVKNRLPAIFKAMTA
jgi:glycosyltransferase involved in cell wall biosynthesis